MAAAASEIPAAPAPEASEAALRAELAEVQKVAAVRHSVDAFARFGVELFVWCIVSGVTGKLLYDSARPPYLWYPLALLCALLLADVVSCWRRGVRLQGEERAVEDRLHALRTSLKLDEPWAGSDPFRGQA